MSLSDDRWSRTATQLAELEERRRPAFTEAVRAFLQPVGTERAIDVGTGTGALAFALAPWVAEVIAVDSSPELLEQARLRAADFPDVTFVEGDGTSLDVLPGTFDIAGCSRTLHHVRRPELFVAELSRVTRPSGSVLVIDQIAPGDPLVAVELDRFERARDPSHTRTLPDIDLRHLFEANGLVVERTRFRTERRELGSYLDLAGCHGEAAERARGLSPGGPDAYAAEAGWYLLRKPR